MQRQRTVKYVLLLALLFATPTFAQTCSLHQRHLAKPWTWMKSNICPADYDAWLAANPPHPWYKDKWFWVGIGVLSATTTAELHGTAMDQPRFQEVGASHVILGPHPSNAALAGWGVGEIAWFGTLHWFCYHKSHKDPSKAWRQIGRWVIPATIGPLETRAAIHDYRLAMQPCVVNGFNVCVSPPVRIHP